MYTIAILALSLSGLIGQAPGKAPAAADEVTDSCDAIRVAKYRPGMSPAEQNEMLDAIGACHERKDKEREAAEAAKPKGKGVNLWD